MNILKRVSWKKILPILFSGLSAIVSLMTTYFVARPLGKEIYGIVQTYVGIINIVSVIGLIGMQYFLNKETQFADNKKGFFTKCFLLVNCWLIIVFPMFFVVSYYLLSSFLASNIIVILMVFFCSYLLISITMISSYLLGTYKTILSSLSTFIPKFLLLICSIVAIFAFNKNEEFPQIYLFLYTGCYLITTIPFLIRLIRKTDFRFGKKQLVSLLFFFLIASTYTLNTSLAKVIGTLYYDSTGALTGTIALSVQIISICHIFTTTIASLSRAVFASLKNEKEELIRFCQKINRINAYFIIPFCTGICLQAKYLLSIFDSGGINGYSAEWPILVVLTIGLLLGTLLGGPNGTMLAMSGHEKLETINGIINIGVFLLFAFLLKGIGAIGLALATTISEIVVNVIKYIETIVIYKKSVFTWKILLHFIIIFIISAACFFGLSFIGKFNIYVLLVLDVIVGGALIVLFFAINPNKEDKRFFFESKF
ncbi:MAG: hypothetical protein WCT17_00340 [Bacilli bacterium]